MGVAQIPRLHRLLLHRLRLLRQPHPPLQPRCPRDINLLIPRPDYPGRHRHRYHRDKPNPSHIHRRLANRRPSLPGAHPYCPSGIPVRRIDRLQSRPGIQRDPHRRPDERVFRRRVGPEIGRGAECECEAEPPGWRHCYGPDWSDCWGVVESQ